jgi:tetratricopeptide (TPR) repeat protein
MMPAKPDPKRLDAMGRALSLGGDQAGALKAYDQAVALAPDEPHYLFNRATVRRFLGDLEGAEADYDRVVALRPRDYEAHLNRSELRTQTPLRNHVASLEALLAEGRADWLGEVRLRYALAKECEDLGQYQRSFLHLSQGAALRRQHLRYDIANDEATAGWIMRAYPQSTEAPAGVAGPIFIVGLPRSGSTLIERILSSHSRVRAGGELPHFTLAVVGAVGARRTREELISHSALLDFNALGRDYLARVRAQGIAVDCFTDKMPLNYLYCGLIRRALPTARIVHVRRHPMAACYAIYKTLFQDGYPFSYDLKELARYYVAYHRLMRHWAETLPGAIHELYYEDLIADSGLVTRRLLEFCGLEWQEACADSHSSTTPVTTASAAQVRRALYDTSVSQWRHYRNQLSDLERHLDAAGLDVN